jgi:hypothetical protein
MLPERSLRQDLQFPNLINLTAWATGNAAAIVALVTMVSSYF